MMILMPRFAGAIASLILFTSALTLNVVAQPLPKLPTTVPQRSLTPSELRRLKRAMQQQIKSNLDLVGLGKTNGQPPIYSNQLKVARANWAKTDPPVAPFIGSWVWNWDTFPPNYRLSIFPSRTKGKVCLIEADTDYDVDAVPVPKEFVVPPKFSTARVTKSSGLGARWRLHRSLITRTRSELGLSGEIEFLGAVTLQNKLRVYASEGLPKLEPNLPTALLRQFQSNQCLASLPKPTVKPK